MDGMSSSTLLAPLSLESWCTWMPQVQDIFRRCKSQCSRAVTSGRTTPPASPRVAVVNEQFARTFCAGANPIGKTFEQRQSGGKPDLVFQIVGLVGNTKYRDLRENSIPIIF